jgi:hypothetical protein
MIRSKRGWVAIVEMSLAVVILFSFFMLAFGNPSKEMKKDYLDIGREVLFQIENNETLRKDILGIQDKDIEIETSLRENIKKFDSSVNLSVCTAEIIALCSSPRIPENKEISAYDFFVTKGEGSKKLKVFLWRE